MTLKQIVEAVDPGVAIAAFNDETKLLYTILATMWLDDKCKKLFERDGRLLRCTTLQQLRI
jgi:hypothetical protein